MSNISKEILRDYINEQKFTSTDEVLIAMKNMFSTPELMIQVST